MNKLGFVFCVCVSFNAVACNSVLDLRMERTGNSQNIGTGGTVTTTSAATSTVTTSTTTTTDTSSGGGGAINEGGAGGSAGEPPVATFSLASIPASGTIVKKSFNVPVVGIVITAGSEDITVPSITLTSQAEIAGSGCSLGEQCAREAAYTRMTSLSIWDGSVQVGWAMSPEPATGKATIPNVNAVVAAGTSKTFVVEASFSSTASSTPFDHVAIGVENGWEITVIDAQQNSVLGTLKSELRGQTGDAPTVVHELRASGELTVTSNHPPMQNIVAGKDVWVPFASYEASAEYEDVRFDFARVMQGSAMADDSDFVQIAVASGGAVHGTGILPAGSTGAVDVFLSNGTITVPAGGSVSFQLWGKMANVLPTGSVIGQSGYPRSGHAPALGIADSKTTGEWTPEYAGNLNLRSTGVTSGERVYAAAGASIGNSMVLRKSTPTVLQHALPTNTLANIDQDLLKFQVAADDAGSIAIKYFWFYCGWNDQNISLSNFRLRRGGMDIPLAEYNISAYLIPSIPAFPAFGIRMRFSDEEQISGSGNVYTVHATVSGATAGAKLSIVANGGSPVIASLVTGPLHVFQSDLGTFIQVHDVSSGINREGMMIWSDLSEQPHSATIAQSSADWTTGLFVQGFELEETLTL